MNGQEWKCQLTAEQPGFHHKAKKHLLKSWTRRVCLVNKHIHLLCYNLFVCFVNLWIILQVSTDFGEGRSVNRCRSAGILEGLCWSKYAESRFFKLLLWLTCLAGSRITYRSVLFFSTVVNENVSLVISRQLLTDFCTHLPNLPDGTAKAVYHFTLEKIQPRVISFEEQVKAFVLPHGPTEDLYNQMCN